MKTAAYRHGWHRGFSDPKPAPRVKDKSVYAEFHAKHWGGCLHCGRWPIEAAHLLRGKNREDVLAGLIPLDRVCHLAFDEGQKGYDDKGRLITPKSVRWAVATFLRSEAGEAQAEYLVEKLNPFGAEAYVQGLEA